jgi:hypothetical protein
VPRLPRIVWIDQTEEGGPIIRRAATIPAGKTGLRAIRKEWKASGGCGPGGSHGGNPGYFTHHGFCYECAICCGNEPTLCFKEGTPCGCPDDPPSGHFYAPCSQITTTTVALINNTCILYTPGSPSIFVNNISELPGPIHLTGPGTFDSCRDCCEPPVFPCPVACAGCCVIGAISVPTHSVSGCGFDCGGQGPPQSAQIPQTSIIINRNGNLCEWDGTEPITYTQFCEYPPDPFFIVNKNVPFSAFLYCGANQQGEPRWIIELTLFGEYTGVAYHAVITGPCPNGPFFKAPGEPACAPNVITLTCGGNDSEAQAPQEWTPDMASRGLGDTVSKAINKATFGLVKPCGGCKNRQAALNKMKPYKRN